MNPQGLSHDTHGVIPGVCVRPLPFNRPLAPSNRIWPAQVVTRWRDGCQIRIDGQIDTILPPEAVPAEWDAFQVRIERDGIVVLPAV